MRPQFYFLSVLLALLLGRPSSGDIVLDPDTSTAVYESSISIPVGTILRMAAIETDLSFPSGVDTAGLDFYWEFSSDTATANPLNNFATGPDPTATAAGNLASTSISGSSTDLLNSNLVDPGDGLKQGTLPTTLGYQNNLGGMGYYGVGFDDFLTASTPIEIMYWNIEFPTVGVVHLGVCGILDSTGNPADPNLNTVGEYYDSDGVLLTGPCSGIEVNVFDSSAIPEPSSFLLLSVFFLAHTGYRRYSRLSLL